MLPFPFGKSPLERKLAARQSGLRARQATLALALLMSALAPLRPLAQPAHQPPLVARLLATDTAWREAQRREAEVCLAVPLVGMATAYTLSLVFTIAAWSWYFKAPGVDDAIDYYDPDTSFDFDDNGIVNHDDERYARRHARAFGGMSVALFAVGVASHRWLLRRTRRRQELGLRTRELLQQRRELIRELRASPALSSHSWGMSLHATF